jgi:hypothetical protein
MLRKVEASAYIRAPHRLVYAVLTEYEAYRDWSPDITDSRVFASEGEVSIVELVSPSLSAGKLILEFVESPDSWLLFNQVDRLREDGLAGRWDLEPADDGDGVVVKGTLSLHSGLLRFGLRRRLRDVLERTIAALTTRCSVLAAAGLARGMGQRRKILEITRVGQGYELTVDGARFSLGPVGGAGAQ